tara:strand:+ start:1317 stop:2639 length:1323 start_codon:yes stop_codon:yes gene_type:complete
MSNNIGWLELLGLVDKQLDKLNESDLGVEEAPSNNITPDLHNNITDKELLEALDKYSQVSNFNLLREGRSKLTAGQKLILSLPKFIPNEHWGNSKSAARIEIKKFIRNIGGRTVAARLAFLMKIQEPNAQITATRRILSSIILLESLQSMLNAYSASGAGYVFEGFIAALMNGEQVKDPKEGSLPIEDVMAFTYDGQRPGIPMSLKLLREKGDTKGSFKNLVDALYARGKSAGMGYLVVFKEGDKGKDLKLKEFTFTNKNMVPVLMKGAGANVNLFNPNRELMRQVAASTKSARLSGKAQYFSKKGDGFEVMQAYQSLPPSEYYILLQATEGYSHERLNEAAAPTQFYIYETFFRESNEDVIQHGTISVSPEALSNTAEMYVGILNEAISNLFTAVADLNENINEYFTKSDREKAIDNGNEARENTKEIRDALVQQMKDK